MRIRPLHASGVKVLAGACALIAGVAAAAAVGGWRARTAHVALVTAAQVGATPGNVIPLNGYRRGPVFDGIGAISGGGGNSRLLVDYETRHPQQAQAVLDYLFKPGYGASLQILKIEIGGDANATDGAEPSYQHVAGKINCAAGYELWLARQARLLNPAIRIYALQWNAPNWVGGGHQNAWTAADIRNVIDWLNCAKSQGVTINAVGGWNEHLPHGLTSTVINWFITLRRALNAAGFGKVKIVAVDSYAHRQGPDVAKLLPTHPMFRAAVSIIGYHNVCAHLSRPYRCRVPLAARRSRKPIWETELGALEPPGGIGSLARSVNDAYIRAHVTGIMEWPLLSSMPADLPVENLGLVSASQPWSGHYAVRPLTWAIAQTTQFTRAGWRYLRGAARLLAAGGSCVGYEAPGRRAWSLVVQTSDARAAQTIAVQVLPGLPDGRVHVWSTNLASSRPSSWFTRRATIRPRNGVFTYRLKPGFIYTFSTTTGQAKGGGPDPAAAPMPRSYSAVPDQTGEPWGLATLDGAFEYLPGSSSIFAQTATGVPDFWQPPSPGQPRRYPYAVFGGTNWRNYAVSVQVHFTGNGQSAGLIARYNRASFRPPVTMFHGYEFTVTTSGRWRLTRIRVRHRTVTLASGRTRALGTSGWHTMTLSVHWSLIVGHIDGRLLVRVRNKAYHAGIAGIRAGGWYQVQFRNLRVSR